MPSKLGSFILENRLPIRSPSNKISAILNNISFPTIHNHMSNNMPYQFSTNSIIHE